MQAGSLCASREGSLSPSHCDPQWQGAGAAWGPWLWLLTKLLIFLCSLQALYLVVLDIFVSIHTDLS